MLLTRVRRIVSASGDVEAGFSLLEAVIASGLMAGALAALGQMFAISVANNRSARAASYATVLALQKMEQLRGLTWGFDPVGGPISDTASDTAAPVDTPTGGTGLSPSPAGTLTSNTHGWVDYVDQSGNALGGGTALPPGTVYIRRWAVEPLPSSPEDTIVLHVFVTAWVGHGDARLMTIKTRKTP